MWAARKVREAHYRDLVENHPFLAARFLPDTTITFANRALATFLDTEPDRLEGTRWVELYDKAFLFRIGAARY